MSGISAGSTVNSEPIGAPLEFSRRPAISYVSGDPLWSTLQAASPSPCPSTARPGSAAVSAPEESEAGVPGVPDGERVLDLTSMAYHAANVVPSGSDASWYWLPPTPPPLMSGTTADSAPAGLTLIARSLDESCWSIQVTVAVPSGAITTSSVTASALIVPLNSVRTGPSDPFGSIQRPLTDSVSLAVCGLSSSSQAAKDRPPGELATEARPLSAAGVSDKVRGGPTMPFAATRLACTTRLPTAPLS